MTLLRNIILSLLVLAAPTALAQGPDPAIFVDAAVEHLGVDALDECDTRLLRTFEADSFPYACAVLPADVDLEALMPVVDEAAQEAGLDSGVEWEYEVDTSAHVASFYAANTLDDTYVVALAEPGVISDHMIFARAYPFEPSGSSNGSAESSSPQSTDALSPGQIRDMIATEIDDAVVIACPADAGTACFRVFGDGDLARGRVDSAIRSLPNAEAASPWRETSGTVSRQWDIGAMRFRVGVEPGYGGDDFEALVWIEIAGQ